MNNFNKEFKKWLFLNLANLITILGFLAVIWLLVIIFTEPEELWLITVLALSVGLSDLFDGKVARKFKIESRFGSIIDRLRDKIFVVPLLIILGQQIWKLNLSFIVVSLTKALIISLVTIEILLFLAWWVGLFKRVTTVANKWGKRKMFCECLVIIFWLASLTIERYFHLLITAVFAIYLIDLMLLLAFFFAIKSLEGYYQSYLSLNSDINKLDS
jgi:phosphatidylglycerophosphate synthase